MFSKISLQTVYDSDSHSSRTPTDVRIEPLLYEPIQQWIDLAVFNPGIEVHVFDDSRELVRVGCVAG